MGRARRGGSREWVQDADGWVRRKQSVIVLLSVDKLQLEVFQIVLQLVDRFFFLDKDQLNIFLSKINFNNQL